MAHKAHGARVAPISGSLAIGPDTIYEYDVKMFRALSLEVNRFLADQLPMIKATRLVHNGTG